MKIKPLMRMFEAFFVEIDKHSKITWKCRGPRATRTWTMKTEVERFTLPFSEQSAEWSTQDSRLCGAGIWKVGGGAIEHSEIDAHIRGPLILDTLHGSSVEKGWSFNTGH